MTEPDELEERPKKGDRVKLCGSHRFAGYTGVYVADRVFYFGGQERPIVKMDIIGKETFVADPERQMRKL